MALVVGFGSTAHAGNDDSFFHGNEAAMMAGAVTAAGTGAGMLWYNPAGLGANQRSRLEISGSLFTLRLRSLAPFQVVAATDPDSGITTFFDSENARSSDILSVPSALSYTRALGEHVTAGFGVFTQVRDQFTVDSTYRPDLGFDLEYRRTLSVDHQRLFLGPGIGAQFGRLRIGASVFFVYESQRFDERNALFGMVDDLGFQATDDFRIDLRRLAVELVLGAQVDVGRRGRLGVTVRGPRFRIDDRIELSYVATEAVGDSTAAAFGHANERVAEGLNELSGPLAAPIEVVLAGGLVTENCSAGAELDLSHRYSALSEYIFTYNLRAGVRCKASDTLEIGGGFFTDRANADANGILDVFADYYGGSFAVTLSTPVGLRHDDGDEEGGPDELIFRSTFALRYAAGIGFGTSGLADLDAIDASPDSFVFDVDLQDLVVHEIGIYIGSGLDF
jgi:hypothetical protein